MPEREGEDPDLPGIYVPPKGSNRPPPPGGGGGPGGGPGGFAGGFGGRRPQAFRGLLGLGENLPVLLRRRGLQFQGAMAPPAPPGRSDTVPAMLSPGEMVMNNGVTQDPQMLQELLAINSAGREQMPGFEGGGIVPENGMGGMPHSNALRILRLLLELDGPTQGFQAGGMVGNPWANRFGGQPSGGGLGGGFGKRGAQPGVNIPRGGPTAAPPPEGGFGYQRSPSGDVTNFDPNNPWGGWSGSQNPSPYGASQRIIGAAGQAGAFDPRGNQALINMQLEGAQGDADALVRRQMAAADLGGLDPAQRQAAKLQALRLTGRGVQDIGAKVRGEFAGRQDEYIKRLMEQQVSANLSQKLSEGESSRLKDRERANRGGGLGGPLGTAAGALLGPVGRAAGGALGRKLFP